MEEKPKKATTKEKAKVKDKKGEVLEAVVEEVKNYSLSTDDIIQNEIRKYSVADAVIAEYKDKFKGLKIKGIDDKQGYKAVKEARSIMRKLRTGVEDKRKELKADSLKIGAGIDAEAKRLTNLIVEVEDPLKNRIEAIDAEIQAEKDKAEKEAEEKLNVRVKELEEVSLKFDGSFYSIGENISVDIVTIKDFSDEVFAEFKIRVSAENDKIVEAEKIRNLHNSRMEALREVWQFLTEEQKIEKFGNLSDEKFKEILDSANKGKADFDETQRKQAEEAKKQADERKSLNYERRSFNLEKEGFKIEDNGDVSFVTEAGAVRFTKDYLETSTVEDFDAEFVKKIEMKNGLNKKAEDLADQRKKDAENKANEEAEASKKQAEEDKFNGRLDALLKLGLKFDGDKTYIFHDINFDVLIDVKLKNDTEWSEALIGATKRKAELEKEIADKEEAERVQKLPEIQKAERYIAEVMKIEIPQINGSEIAEILADFKNKIKIASDEAMSNLKKLA